MRRAPAVETPVYDFSGQAATATRTVEAPVAAAATIPDTMVELPLKKLWHKLNPTVVQGATTHPNGDSTLQMPLSYLHSHLAKGAVKIPFTEFCNFAPQGLFTPSADSASWEVDLPIADVLSLLKPEHLVRRPNQRKLSVPDDIGPIFGPDGAPAHGLRIADTKGRATKPTAPAAPTPAPFAAPKVVTPPLAAPAMRPVVAEQKAETILPPIPAPVRAPITPISPIAPAEILSPIAPAVAEPVATLRNDPIPAPKLDPSLATLKPKVAAPIPATIPPPSAPAPVPAVAAPIGGAPGRDHFTLPLMDVAAFWSDKGRNDLANLYRHSLEIPMSTLESTLKTGRLNFQWREVRPWLRLAPGNTMPTLQDDLAIELPIAIIAPRFIEQRAQGKPKRRMEVGEDIPDVFEQKIPARGQTIPSTPATPPLGATAVPMDLSSSLTASSSTGDTAFLARTGGKTLLEFGEIFGQPEKKNWSLAEVAQKTMTLRGVTGSIIGSADGLMIAGAWPNGVKGDAVAAFLPQLYGRILQYTKELKLGEPGNVTLMIENLPLQIFKAGTSYFIVLGRAGENLPKAQLNAIAARLTTNFSGK